MSVEGKVALMTGAATGIGAALDHGKDLSGILTHPHRSTGSAY